MDQNEGIKMTKRRSEEYLEALRRKKEDRLRHNSEEFGEEGAFQRLCY